MEAIALSDGQTEQSYVSTGHLPSPEHVQRLVDEGHARFKSNTEGENSQVYPALARVPSDLFGICVVGTSGSVYAAGDAEHEFSIMSVSKPFVFALVCEVIGADEARAKLGANATGSAVQFAGRHRTQRRRADQPDGERRRDRDDQPGARRDRRRQMEVHPRRPVALRRAHAAAERGGLRVRVGDQLPQPQHRLAAPKHGPRSTAIRSRRPICTRGNAR